MTLDTLKGWIRNPNIAGDIKEDTLSLLATQVLEDFKRDKDSMDDWEKFVKAGRRLTKQELEGKSEPWDKSANFKSPVLLQASIKFGDRANLALLKAKDLVKIDVIGNDESNSKRDTGDRIATHMNYQINYEMKNWRDDQDKLLYLVSSEGCIFKKTFFDSTLGRNISEIVKYPDFAVNQKATGLEEWPFSINQDFKMNAVLEKQAAGIWREADLKINTSHEKKDDETSDQRFIEQQCWYDLDGDDYEEPYLVTVHVNTKEVVRVVARFEEQNIIVKASDDTITDLRRATDQGLLGLSLVRIDPINSITKYGFIPDFIDSHYLNLGYLHLLASITQAINSSSNHLLNSGFLANLQGGWLAKKFRKTMGPLMFKPGRWEQTDIEARDLQAGVLPHQFKEPSATLLNMNQGMTAEAKETVSITDLVSAVGANAPATTMLGMIQEQLMPVTALIIRLYRAEKEEFLKLYRLNAEFTDPEQYQTILDEEADFQADYQLELLDVMPAANPEMTSKIQMLVQSQALLDESDRILAMGGNPIPIMRDFLDAIGVDTQEIFPVETEEQEKARLEELRADKQLQTDVIKKQLELAEREVQTLEQNRLIQLEKAKVEIGKIQSDMILNLEKAETEETKNAISTYTAALQGLDAQLETLQNDNTGRTTQGTTGPAG